MINSAAPDEPCPRCGGSGFESLVVGLTRTKAPCSNGCLVGPASNPTAPDEQGPLLLPCSCGRRNIEPVSRRLCMLCREELSSIRGPKPTPPEPLRLECVAVLGDQINFTTDVDGLTNVTMTPTDSDPFVALSAPDLRRLREWIDQRLACVEEE